MTTSTLHRALVHSSAADLERLARRHADHPNLGLLLPDEGERTWPRLADHEGAEVWLSWPEGVGTGRHDHHSSRGSFAVASGAVVETSYELTADGPVPVTVTRGGADW